MIVLAATTLTLSSHECWLQPKKFKLGVGEALTVDFLVGENFEGEPWDLKKNKIEKLQLAHLENTADLRTLVKPDGKQKLAYKLTAEGTYLLSMESDAAFLEMDGAKFNAHLQDEGLDDILAIRTKANALDKPGREWYSRNVKLLVQAGARTDNTFKKNSGMRLEIIPAQNPYVLKSGSYLQCLILFDGRPAAHQLIKLWNKIGNTTFLQNVYTENDGTVKFPISSKGPWMVSTVKMVPSEKSDGDWQSYWGSLVFGIE